MIVSVTKCFYSVYSGGGNTWPRQTSHLNHKREFPALEKGRVRTRLTLLTVGSEEARVALAGVTVDGLYTFTVATAGSRSAGSYRKHKTDEDDQFVWCWSCIFYLSLSGFSL